jgi:hypothetical protein
VSADVDKSAVSQSPQPLLDAHAAQAVMDFNLRPALYADASWLPKWALGCKLIRGTAVERALSAGLIQERGLAGAWDWKLAAPVSRLFASPARDRSLVALAVGACAHRKQLLQVVLKPQLNSLNLVLGDLADGLWNVAVNAVPSAASNAADSLSEAWWRLDPAILRRRLHDAGAAWLLGLFERCDPAQRASADRALLCLPRPCSDRPVLPLDAKQRALLERAVFETIIPRWAPACNWSF